MLDGTTVGLLLDGTTVGVLDGTTVGEILDGIIDGPDGTVVGVNVGTEKPE